MLRRASSRLTNHAVRGVGPQLLLKFRLALVSRHQLALLNKTHLTQSKFKFIDMDFVHAMCYAHTVGPAPPLRGFAAYVFPALRS